jgi:NAD-dependent dihydropyrimidine dehydrogenase PreA subunit
VPGFEGNANTLLAAALVLKGYRVRGVCAFNMPANWLTLHPGYSVAGAQYVYQRVRSRVQAMTERIARGRRYFPADAAIVAVLGLALLPVTAAYMAAGRPFLAKTLFASKACTNCGLCIRVCPSGGLRAVGRARPGPYWTYRCEQCMRCVAYCPAQAVEANLPYLVCASLAAASPLAFPSVGASLRAWLQGTPFSSGFLFWRAWIAAVFVLAGAGQWVLFALARTPLLRTVLSVTGVSHFYRKSHAPGVSLAELTRSRHGD